MSEGRRLGLRSMPGTYVPRVRSMSRSVTAVTPSTTMREARSRLATYLASICLQAYSGGSLRSRDFLLAPHLPSVTQTSFIQGLAPNWLYVPKSVPMTRLLVAQTPVLNTRIGDGTSSDMMSWNWP